MAQRLTPPDGSARDIPARALPVPALSPRNRPPDVDRTTRSGARSSTDYPINPLGDREADGRHDTAPETSDNAALTDAAAFDQAASADMPKDEEVGGETISIDFLSLVREAEEQALLYTNQANKRAWAQAYHAWHNEHYVDSKYRRPDYRNRSKLFIPKTRSSVRKDMAAVAASLFNTQDAVTCSPGNEADPRQRASAAVVQELVNYRTNRTSGRAAIPWFHVSMGARQDAMLTGICMSKQFWRLELRKEHSEEVEVDEDGNEITVKVEKWVPDVDRPECFLFPPENYVIDPAADWTDPAQTASYAILKYPMRLDEIKERMNAPINPWHKVDDETLRSSAESTKFDMAAIRRSREQGLDRMDETQTGIQFQIIWVYETFMKVAGEDWTFISVGSKEYLTDPRPTREVYPEQIGDRPLVMGYGALESHRIFPMAPVISWQQLQVEINDTRNLVLDAYKQNVMPVTKVVRGKQVDLDQIKRRSSGSSIVVQNKDDVTWERPPEIPQSAPVINRDLDLFFDDLAGQFNNATTQNNNALSRTLGGLKLVAGSANAVQEFDIRTWISTWCDPVLAQIVRLEQYYESDPVVLGLCGDRAQLMQKYGINKVDDDLLQQQVTIGVSIGLGAGDPQARLAKFQSAVAIAAPLLAQSPEFQSGEWQMDAEAVIQEVFGAAGYRDGGKRFFKQGQPKPNPMGDLQQQILLSQIALNKSKGKASIMTGLASLAKVNLGDRQLEADNANAQMDQYMRAHDMGRQHGNAHVDNLLAATAHGHEHGLNLRQHALEERKHNLAERQHDLAERQHQAQMVQGMADAIGGGGEAQGAPAGGGGGGEQAPAEGPSDQKLDEILQMLQLLMQQLGQRPQGGGFNPQPYGAMNG